MKRMRDENISRAKYHNTVFNNVNTQYRLTTGHWGGNLFPTECRLTTGHWGGTVFPTECIFPGAPGFSASSPRNSSHDSSVFVFTIEIASNVSTYT